MTEAVFIFAHGAGADSNSNFMQQLSAMISDQHIKVILFDFPYMQRRKDTGKKSPPDRMPKLEAAFIEQIKAVRQSHPTLPLFIGGKSMGGRVASMLADAVSKDYPIAGVICFGYPFHPPAKPEKTRTEHLASLQTPCLIIQGTRDTFGKPHEVATYQLANTIDVCWIEDGDHSLETLKRSKLTSEQSWQQAAQVAKQFIVSH